MDQEKIGRFIAQKRKEQGLTQRELARRLGVGDKAVSKWECGRGLPDYAVLLPLCGLLQIQVNELLSGEMLSAQDYHEKAEDLIMNLMKEKERLTRKEGRSRFLSASCAAGIGLAAALFALCRFCGPGLAEGGWILFLDTVSLLMDVLLTLLVLALSGRLGVFFGAFPLCFQKAAQEKRLEEALRAVRLAAVSLLLGGALTTLLGLIPSLCDAATARALRVNAAVSLLSLFYGILLALLLLPLAARLSEKLRSCREREAQ